MNKLSLIASGFVVVLLSGCAGKVPVLGVSNGELTPCPDKSNCVYSQSTDPRHQISPIVVSASMRETKLAVMRALEELKGNVIEVRSDYIKAEFISPVFRFVDDVELYFPESDSREKLIHVRSASRVGYSDFGVNRERIESIRHIVESITSN